HGSFAWDTRVLSRGRISADGREPTLIRTADVCTHPQLSYAELNEGETLPSRAADLRLERFVGEGLRTRLTFLSYAGMQLSMPGAVEVAADFADTGEVERGQRRQHGDVAVTWRPE